MAFPRYASGLRHGACVNIPLFWQGNHFIETIFSALMNDGASF